jgi:hypothetical protein
VAGFEVVRLEVHGGGGLFPEILGALPVRIMRVSKVVQILTLIRAYRCVDCVCVCRYRWG